jgi:hypothetical protein
MRRTRWIFVLTVALGLVLAGWPFRHDVLLLLRAPFLPSVEPLLAGTTRVALIGDYGTGTARAAEVARMVKRWKPHFVATLGDNDYGDAAGGIDRAVGRLYHEYIAPYKGRYGTGGTVKRFFPIPGHRDWDRASLQPYLEYFTLPGNERYYEVVLGPVHLFMLDTDEREPDGATEASPQARWLQERLAKSTASWKLVLAHHAPYTSHEVDDIRRMRWPFETWGADAVLSGFYHVYERLQVGSLPYFVNGAGGAWVSRFGITDPHSRFRYAEDNGVMLVDASSARITFRFVTRRGRIVDEYELVRGPQRESPGLLDQRDQGP